MPDELTPGTGQGEPGGQEFDFQRGYTELRPEYTRVTQENSEYRDRLSEYEQLFAALHDDSDPEAQAAAMAYLGLEMETGSPGGKPAEYDDEEWTDPLEETVARLESELSELRSARELEAAEAEERELDDLRDQFIDQSLSALEEDLKPQFGDNFKFANPEKETLGNLAIAMSDEDDIPDIQAAFQALYGKEGVLEINRSRWTDSKNANVAPAGTTIPADQRPKNGRERASFMDERLAALDRQR